MTARLGPDRQRLVLQPFRTQEIVFAPAEAAGRATTARQLYPLRLGSRLGATTERDGRALGSFVVVTVDERG